GDRMRFLIRVYNREGFNRLNPALDLNRTDRREPGWRPGASDRQAYTIYGDTVNCAQRLEAANKSHGSVIMIDAETFHGAGAPAGFAPVGPIQVKGRVEPIETFAIVNADQKTHPVSGAVS
ncbi:MAG: adenylate/guanylate cyclase domain-containing protein, partial [Pseudomonadota bacterium]